jgi:hypothetical protein
VRSACCWSSSASRTRAAQAPEPDAWARGHDSDRSSCGCPPWWTCTVEASPRALRVACPPRWFIAGGPNALVSPPVVYRQSRPECWHKRRWNPGAMCGRSPGSLRGATAGRHLHPNRKARRVLC